MNHCRPVTRTHLFISLCLLVPGGGGAVAQNVASAMPESPLQEIVVTATRTEQSIGKLPNNVSVISGYDIDHSASQTADSLLRQIPGFNMLRQQDSMAASPTTQGASLRGIGGTAASRSLVLLDGVPIHDAFSSRVYWSRVPRHRIERIEVVRGGGSTLWGNRTVGGVINIITAKPRAGGLDLSGAYGSADTVDVSADASHVMGDWSLAAYGDYYNTDGYWTIPEDERDPVNVRVARKSANIGAHAGYALSDRLDVFANANWLNDERQDDTPQDVDKSDIVSLGTGANFRTDGGSTWRLNLFSDIAEVEDDSTRVTSGGTADELAGHIDQDSVAVGASLTWSRTMAERHLLSAGVDYLTADAEIDQFLDYANGRPTLRKAIDGDQQLLGFFLQDVFSFSDAWEFIASGRFDYVANDGSSVDTSVPDGNFISSDDFDRNSETTFNPNVGFRYRASDEWSWRGSAYGGFRAATLRELYRSNVTGGRSILLTANPDLGPEKLKGIEGGVDFSPADNLLLRGTVFFNVVDDVIQNVTIGTADISDTVIEPCGLVMAGMVCQQLQNVGQLEATGLELEVNYQFTPNWRFFVSYLLQNVEISKAPDNPQLVGNQVRQSADNQFTAKIDYQNPVLFDVSLQGRYVGERFEDDLNQLPVDDFFLVDLVVTKAFDDNLELFLVAENLFDKEYEIRVNARGAREIGRDRFLSLGIRYRR